MLEPLKPPLVKITDADGTTCVKAIPLAELLTLLDKSATLVALEREAIRTLAMPLLPERAMYVTAIEYPEDLDYIVTGWQEPGEWPFVLKSHRKGIDRVYPINLPPLVWRAHWRRSHRALVNLAVAVLAPDQITPPPPDAPVFRYPFSNVYSNRGGAVCWPTMHQIKLELHEVWSGGVGGFLAVVNNNDLYGVSGSQNSPYREYDEFLRAVQSNGGLQREWLIPQEMDLARFHEIGGEI